jgi:hypothetical protein
MEELIKGSGGPKDEHELKRVSYDKQQINLEKTFEACSNLLFFFIDGDSSIVNTIPTDTIKACGEVAIKTLKRVITTPLVASACQNMFPFFIEALVHILLTLEQPEGFIKEVAGYIALQSENLKKLLGAESFD